MEGEVAIAELEPVRCADLAELVERVPALTGEPPSAFAVAESSECVEECVVVGADGEAMQLKVVARIGDDAQFTVREGAVEAVAKLCAADPASEECNAPTHAVRPGSTSRPKASAHSTWFRPTLCR